MPFYEMIIGLSAGLFMLTGFIYFLRLIQAWLLHRTLRSAIQGDSPLAASLVDRLGGGDLSTPKLPPSTDDRTGLILVALGLALVGFALVAGDPSWLRYCAGAGLFPGLVGAALLWRHRMVRRAAAGPDIVDGG